MIYLKGIDFCLFSLDDYLISFEFLPFIDDFVLVNNVLFQRNKMHPWTLDLIMFRVYADSALSYLQIELVVFCFVSFAAVEFEHV